MMCIIMLLPLQGVDMICDITYPGCCPRLGACCPLLFPSAGFFSCFPKENDRSKRQVTDYFVCHLSFTTLTCCIYYSFTLTSIPT